MKLSPRYETLTVIQVWKQCVSCRAVWQGNYFEEWLPGEEAGTDQASAIAAHCDGCIDGWERARKQRDLIAAIALLEEKMRGIKPTKLQQARGLRKKFRLFQRLQATYQTTDPRWTKLALRMQALAGNIKELEKAA